jgi:hypothetical protein
VRRLIGLIAIGSVRAQRMSRRAAIAQRMASPMPYRLATDPGPLYDREVRFRW